MNQPTIIRFKSKCDEALRKNILAPAPEEGCALLIGTKANGKTLTNELIWEVSVIWPCCNVWECNMQNFHKNQCQKNIGQEKASRINRFAIDPREQLRAQKWARNEKLSILGSAHSHPSSSAIPSKLDLSMNYSTGLMTIINGLGEIRAWWVNNQTKKTLTEIKIQFHS
ncbi:Mov34/MPN/PAD-1 family protein [Prochlorococcus sp. MIT 0601]|uniref:Mov34/MPN/PAD-1 family protein n=2 Tax=Prochlorococcus TaxID=1218 RepID=UPI0005338D7F|nr:Mov34/MPN/PAD-1 family protein [Prochlorococcus sp. MIT 0601]KGG13592.1 Metal-dependent protease of the PAD1/JAB1 [Prochlorococcus sp. MIT 0601]